MKPAAQAELSKLQIIATLFASTFGEDLYYAAQIKASIEAALPEGKHNDIATFIHYAEQLATQVAQETKASPVGLVPTQDDHGFSILNLRAQLLAAIKKTCHSNRPLVVLTGLKEAICPTGKRWTPRRKQEYQEAIAYARDFCHARSRPSSKLSLVIF